MRRIDNTATPPEWNEDLSGHLSGTSDTEGRQGAIALLFGGGLTTDRGTIIRKTALPNMAGYHRFSVVGHALAGGVGPARGRILVATAGITRRRRTPIGGGKTARIGYGFLTMTRRFRAGRPDKGQQADQNQHRERLVHGKITILFRSEEPQFFSIGA